MNVTLLVAHTDNANINEICKKIFMGYSVSNRNGIAFKTGGKPDINKLPNSLQTEELKHSNLKFLPD